MSPKGFVPFNQGGTEILRVQFRCLQTKTETQKKETNTETDLVLEVGHLKSTRRSKYDLGYDPDMHKYYPY